jgi:hypothetical protein
MTDQPTAPERVPDEYYDSDVEITVCEAGSGIGLYLWRGESEWLTPDQADELADALKAYAAAARKRGTHE